MKRKLLVLLMCAALAVTSVTPAQAFGGSPGYTVTWDMMHPELRLAGSLARLLLPDFSEGLFKVSNLILETFGRGVDLTEEADYEEIYIDREDGSKLRLCVYTPEVKRENVPGLLWIHGGGYAMGIPEQDYAFIENFVAASGCVVAAPDYTNSTAAPYPAALNDCYAALLWLRDNGGRFGMRPDQVFVGGDSAGGGLTAAVCLLARDLGEVSVAFQMPLYPMLDDRMTTASSQNNDAPIWSSQSNEAAWKLYLGEDYGTDAVSKYAAPARETDYRGLPPALTYVGTVEPFTDETIRFVEDLRAAGV